MTVAPESIAPVPLSIDELAHLSIILAGYCDALDSLHDAASSGQGEPPDIVTRRARNALTPVIETVIQKAHELSEEISRTALHVLKAGWE